jgi:hypothetical protein
MENIYHQCQPITFNCANYISTLLDVSSLDVLSTANAHFCTKGTSVLINIITKNSTDWVFGSIVTYATLLTLALKG